MDHFSTVLQRPPHFDEDGSNGAPSEDRGPRGGLRDILNPVSSTSQAPLASSHATPGTPGAPAPPRPQSSFSLRSPTQSDYHHPNPYSPSPSSTAVAREQPSGSRSILNNPFGSTSTPSLPPPLQAPQSIASSTAASSSTLQHPPRSPLHAPQSVYYSSEIRDREPIREKTGSSSFYDPTLDTKRERDRDRDRERRVSEGTGSWRNTTQNSTPKVSNPPQTNPNCKLSGTRVAKLPSLCSSLFHSLSAFHPPSHHQLYPFYLPHIPTSSNTPQLQVQAAPDPTRAPIFLHHANQPTGMPGFSIHQLSILGLIIRSSLI